MMTKDEDEVLLDEVVEEVDEDEVWLDDVVDDERTVEVLVEELLAVCVGKWKGSSGLLKTPGTDSWKSLKSRNLGRNIRRLRQL